MPDSAVALTLTVVDNGRHRYVQGAGWRFELNSAHTDDPRTTHLWLALPSALLMVWNSCGHTNLNPELSQLVVKEAVMRGNQRVNVEEGPFCAHHLVATQI
jgi:hypothetical protein